MNLLINHTQYFYIKILPTITINGFEYYLNQVTKSKIHDLVVPNI